MKNNISFDVLSKAKIQEKRDIVISKSSKGGFTIAQQIKIDEAGRETSVFLKHGIIIDDIDGLLNFRDALNVALEKINNDNEESWLEE